MTTLQEAARVKITPQTQKKITSPIKNKQLRRLREERVKEYILSKPYGQRIRISDIADVVDPVRGRANMHVFIDRMIKKGVISKHEITPRTFWFSVNGPVKIIQPAAASRVGTGKVGGNRWLNSDETDRKIMDVIRKWPGNRPIKLMDFAYEGTGYTSDAGVYNKLQSMIGRGLIERHLVPGMKHTYLYSVIEPDKPEEVAETEEPVERQLTQEEIAANLSAAGEGEKVEESIAKDAALEHTGGKAKTGQTAREMLDMLRSLEQTAMRFAWNHPEDHNDLRKFITWLQDN